MPHYLDSLRSLSFRSLLRDEFGKEKLIDITDEFLFDELQKAIDSHVEKKTPENAFRGYLYRTGLMKTPLTE